MAKVKYDVSNAEAGQFKVPKPGVYEAAISQMSHGDSNNGNPMFTIVFEITKGEFKGSRIWYYILTDGSQAWRLRQFTDALGLPTKGTLDPDTLKGTVVQVKTGIDPARDGYDEKARIASVLPASGKSGGGDEGEEEPPYEEWELSDLKEEAEARELEIKGKVTKKKLVDALNADDEEDEGEGEEDEDEEEDEEGEDEEPEAEGDEDEYTMTDLKKMDRAELKKVVEEEELEIRVSRKTSDDTLREKIAEALEIGDEEGEDEEGEDEDEDEDTNYEEWEISDLKSELKDRGLETKGRKSALVARLKKDDANDGDEPF